MRIYGLRQMQVKSYIYISIYIFFLFDKTGSHQSSVVYTRGYDFLQFFRTVQTCVIVVNYYRGQPKAGTVYKMLSVPFFFSTSRFQGPAFRCDKIVVIVTLLAQMYRWLS